MTKSKARQMGFKPADSWDYDRLGYWVRQLSRPVCTELWRPSEPDVIERITSIGPAARIHEKRRESSAAADKNPSRHLHRARNPRCDMKGLPSSTE